MNREQKLEEALRMLNCPRPCNHRPDEFSISDCVKAGECGCVAGAALSAPKAEDLDLGMERVGKSLEASVESMLKRLAGSEELEPWPALKIAIWRVLADEKLNDGHYIKTRELTEKLYAAVMNMSPVPALTDEAVERAAKAMYDLKPFHGLDNRPDPIPWPEYALANPELAETMHAKARAALLAAFPSKGEGE